jgi:hypothetical protein
MVMMRIHICLLSEAIALQDGYVATPLPKDQFSFLTSPGFAASLSAMAL